MSEFLTAVIQYNKCYQDTYYNHNNLYYQLHAFDFLQVFVYFSSSDIFIVNSSGNVLLIEFAIADRMPELPVFVVINAISIACMVFRYLIKNTISVITSIMSHVKAI